MVVEGANDARLAVECAGDAFDGPDRWASNMSRQRILEGAGWTFWLCFASTGCLRKEKVFEVLIECSPPRTNASFASTDFSRLMPCARDRTTGRMRGSTFSPDEFENVASMAARSTDWRGSSSTCHRMRTYASPASAASCARRSMSGGPSKSIHTMRRDGVATSSAEAPWVRSRCLPLSIVR
jgi:hypothetical protein